MSTSHFHLSGDQQRPTNSTLLIAATVWLINHIYARYTNSLTFSLWSSTVDNLHAELLSEILTGIREAELTYVIGYGEGVVRSNEDSEQAHQLGRPLHSDVIEMVDSFEAFMKFKKQVMLRHFHISGYFSILYTSKDGRYYDVIMAMFRELFAIYVTNANIYVQLPLETLMFSFYPFTEYHCQQSIAVLQNRFNKDGYMYSKPFFVRKTDNLYGCPITVATWKGPPFVFFQRLADGEVKIRGIEGALISMLANKLNFTIQLEEASRRGYVMENLTIVDGAVKMVVDGKANITINSYVLSKSFLNFLAASYTYSSYSIIVAVPRGHSLSPFERLLRPFKYVIWSCLSSSVLAGIILIFLIKCLRRRNISSFVFGPLNSTPFTNLLNTFFGGQLTLVPQRNFARYILIVWLLYTMVLRNVYSGELYIMLQDSTSRTNLKELNDLIERNFTLLCTDNTVEIIFRSTKVRDMEFIRGQPFSYLAKLHDSEAKLGIVIFRPFLRLYNWIIRGRVAPIRTLPRPLVTLPMTMYMRQDSYLLEPINEYLIRFQAVGMTNIWDRLYLPSEESMMDVIDREPSVLSVELLMGLFIVYLVLLGFSLIVFGLEVWSRHSPICRIVVDFLNF